MSWFTRFSQGKIWFVDIGPCKRFEILQLWMSPTQSVRHLLNFKLWSEWWENMTWPTKRQWQIQIQWQIYLENKTDCHWYDFPIYVSCSCTAIEYLIFILSRNCTSGWKMIALVFWLKKTWHQENTNREVFLKTWWKIENVSDQLSICISSEFSTGKGI